MTPRERVLTSFRHRTPDRVPLDYSAVPELDNLLMRRLRLPDREALLRRLHIDFRHLDKDQWGEILPRYIGPEPPERDDGVIEDMWGCRFKKVEYRPGCFYMEFADYPQRPVEKRGGGGAAENCSALRCSPSLGSARCGLFLVHDGRPELGGKGGCTQTWTGGRRFAGRFLWRG